MSLIQDALKRQQNEYGDGKTPKVPPPTVSELPVTETMPVMEPPAPATVPPAPATEPPVPPPMPLHPPLSAKSTKPWKMIGGIAAIAIVVLAAGGIIVTWLLKMAREKTIAALVAQTEIPDAGVSLPTPGAVPDKVQDAKPVVPPPAPKTELPLSPASVPPVPVTTVSEEPVSSLVPASETANEQDVPLARKSPPVKSPPVPLQWPALKLTGILSSASDGEGAARINNQMVFIGGQIEGVTLVEIRADGVYLKYGKETRFLKMGGALY